MVDQNVPLFLTMKVFIPVSKVPHTLILKLISYRNNSSTKKLIYGFVVRDVL